MKYQYVAVKMTSSSVHLVWKCELSLECVIELVMAMVDTMGKILKAFPFRNTFVLDSFSYLFIFSFIFLVGCGGGWGLRTSQ